MSTERINVEAFQIRVNTGHRLTVRKGLGVSAFNGERFLDAQYEPGYNTGNDRALPENLWLRLSKDWQDTQLDSLFGFSMNPNFLKSDKKQAERFRLFPPVQHPLGRLALVSVVNYDNNPLLPAPFGLFIGEESKRLKQYQIVTNHFGIKAYDRHVGLAMLHEGERLFVHQETGSYFSNVERVCYQYLPDSPTGLVEWRAAAVPPEPPSAGGDPSGDREPRKPLPTAPVMAASIE